MMATLAFLISTCVFITTYADPPQHTIPDCAQPNPPFIDETEALNVARVYLGCLYNYYKSNSEYKGVNGFRQMFGDDGYLYNASTEFDSDGTKMHSYRQMRAKAVVIQNIMSWIREPYNVSVSAWFPYNVSFHFTVDMELNFGVFKKAQKTAHTYAKITWFEDESGIMEYRYVKSSSSIIGTITSASFKTTQLISGMLGYLDDDVENDDLHDNKYIENPIQIIFICVFSVLTFLIASCVCGCVRFSYGKFMKKSVIIN
eukprot:205499_1